MGSETGDRSDRSDGSRSGRQCVSRRRALKTLGAAGGAGAFGVSPFVGSARALASPWTIAVLPDTQKYAESSTLITRAHDQTRWIAENRSKENIVFVSHEGDLVEHGNDESEWGRIASVMDRLDGVVPYATVIGNHDYAVLNDRGSSSANYSKYFGESRYEGKSWFGGTGPNDRGHYQRFSAGGYQFLHLDLEWGVPGSTSDPNTVMGWARSVLRNNRTKPTIITTHAYLWDRPGYEGHATRADGANSGRAIYRKLVKPNPQVFMVFNGHYHKADGQWRQASSNNAGSKVYEMLANYQHYANGGDGWMRLVKFIPGGGNGTDRVQVRTYSPSRNEFKTDSRSQFNFDFGFSARFG